MTAFSQRLTITLPSSLADIAAMIGRAMDTDVGGERSFSPVVTGYDGENAIYGDEIRCSTPCTEAFKERALAMIGNPEILHHACTMDYARRWPALTHPTLEQCVAFVAAAKID